MSALADLQNRVARAVREGGDMLADLVRETPDVPRDVRLGIYRDAYLLRLDEALRSNYPKLHLVLGDDDMLALTGAYQAAHPSRRPSIRWFGDELPAFLRGSQRFAAQPVLADLARFEWCLCAAFDAADGPVLGVDALGGLAEDAWPALVVHFHPSLGVLPLSWNVPAIWHALNDDEQVPAPAQLDACWVIWRCDMQPRFRSLAPDEAALIGAIARGEPFAQACEALLAYMDEMEAPMRAASLLGGWMAEGWVARLG